MGWTVIVILVSVFCVISILGARALASAHQRAAEYGPRSDFATMPRVAEGRLTWDFSPGHLAGTSYRIMVHAQGFDVIARLESTAGVSSWRSHGEIALTFADGTVDGRATNGTTMSSVRGEYSARRIEVVAGVELTKFLGKLRQPTVVETADGQVTIESSGIREGNLQLESRRIVGGLVDSIGQLKVEINHRDEVPAGRLALVVVLAAHSIHSLVVR